MSLEPGQVIEGKYRIKRLIGEGGMGAVFEGENTRIQRRVAIKVLHPSFTGNKDVTQRFERESQAAGRIGNDHILEVLDMGTLADGSHFMVLEFLDGEPLSARVKRLSRMTPDQVAPLARQMLAGLGAAHAAGIVHRDLKPDNIYILKEKAGVRDYVKIIDFGISKFQPLAGDGMKMTSTGAVMGTPYYMSPEQASGSQQADGRSDLYSVGVILYECVTGRVPFDGETFNQLMFKIVLSDPPPLLDLVPDLNPAFASIVLKAMTRDATQRFQTADEFSSALAAWIERGAQVSIPAPGPSDAVARSALASASGHSPPKVAPGVSKSASSPGVSKSASLPGIQGTVGTFATSQPSATPAKNTIVIAAIAGGLALAAAVIGVLVFTHGGSSSAAHAAASGETTAIAAPKADPLPPSSPEIKKPEPEAPAPSPPKPEAVPVIAVAPATAKPASTAVLSPTAATAARPSAKSAQPKSSTPPRRTKDDFGY
jgi:serine/threonine protein kinase